MPPRETWVWLVEAALAEDLGSGDVTSQALIRADLSSAAHLEVRESSILAGMEVAREVFARKAWDAAVIWEGVVTGLPGLA